MQRQPLREDDLIGRCHRQAPAPAPGGFQYEVLEWLYNEREIERDPGRSEDAVTIWPMTVSGDWCGEFDMREDVDEG